MLMVPILVLPPVVAAGAGAEEAAALGAAGQAADEAAGSVWARATADASTATAVKERISVGFM